MRPLALALIVIVILAGLILLVGGMWIIKSRNHLVTLDEGVKQAWSQVQNQYQRRMDLIPNLVNTVKGVANFEKETYTAVADARSKAGQINLSPQLLNDPQAFAAFEKTQGELSSALSRLLVTVERYPELKANQNFTQLMDELAGTENRIAVERRRFNEVVQTFNTTVRRFPMSLIAGWFGFPQKPYFQAATGAAEAPKVQF